MLDLHHRLALEAKCTKAPHLPVEALARHAEVASQARLIGVGILLATGRSPLDGGPDLELTRLWEELPRFDAPALLWLGLIAVIATPIGRVVLAGAAFARQRDWLMLCVAAAILAIMVVGVLIAGTDTV
jgi:uncharacterized membrane protein